MSTQLSADLTPEAVRTLSEERGEPAWLTEFRLDALDALDGLDMPDVIRTPGRRWTDLESLEFESLVDPRDQSESREIEADGDAVVVPFREATDEYGELVEAHLGGVVDPHDDYLTALSAALFTSGTLVYVPEGVDAEDVTVRTEMDGRTLLTRTLVVTERSASVTILERTGTGADAADRRYHGDVVEVVGGENSYTQYGSLQTLDEETYHVSRKRAVADDHATVDFVEGNLGSCLTRSDVEAVLDGEGSEAKIVGAFFGRDDQHLDVNARVWHEAEHTTADLATRGVLDDEARSVYEGVQDVGRGAWDTSSYQRENTLLLSDDAEADASPKLIINNHDTEASHSATVGQVDREDLFFMTSRSIDPETARDMLVEGFFVPVLDEVAVDELREDLEAEIAARLR